MKKSIFLICFTLLLFIVPLLAENVVVITYEDEALDGTYVQQEGTVNGAPYYYNSENEMYLSLMYCDCDTWGWIIDDDYYDDDYYEWCSVELALDDEDDTFDTSSPMGPHYYGLVLPEKYEGDGTKYYVYCADNDEANGEYVHIWGKGERALYTNSDYVMAQNYCRWGLFSMNSYDCPEYSSEDGDNPPVCGWGYGGEGGDLDKDVAYVTDVVWNPFNQVEVIVWYDANQNGQVDELEKGLQNVIVRAIGDDKCFSSKHYTNSHGITLFKGMLDGEYTFMVDESTLPEGASCTTEGLLCQVNVNNSNSLSQILFGVYGGAVMIEADDPVNGETPQLPGNQLVFVEGSVVYDKGSKPCNWENLVDNDLEGWDGTVLACPPEDDVDTVPWAIFKFAGGEHKFNYVTFQTDNGDDDNGEQFDYQVRSLEVLVSSTGTDPEDFTSIGTFKRTYGKNKLQWNRLSDYVSATYIKVRLIEPEFAAGWRQIVELGVETDQKQGAIPVNNESDIVLLPLNSQLYDCYPNPFNPVTTIPFDLAQESHVKLAVYDLTGRQVVELVNEVRSAGQYQEQWNAAQLPSSLYFVKLDLDGKVLTKSLILMK